MLLVPAGDRLAAQAVSAAGLQAIDEGRQDVVLDPHAIGRGVAGLRGRGTGPIQIALPHQQGVEAQVAGDVAHEGLDQEHALRPTKAPKGRIGLGVRLAAQGIDAHMLEEVGIVQVEQGPVIDRTRQVGREAALAGQHCLQTQDAALRIEAHLVAGQEIVALAGDHEVVITIQTHLDRAPGQLRRQRCPYRRMPGLRLLASETAPHASRLDRHVVVG